MKTCLAVLTWLALLAQAVYIGLLWPDLPATLPSHFGLDGLPNRYAPKSILWVILGISILMAIVISIALRFPRSFNLPKPTGDPDRPRVEAIAHDMLLWIRLEIACLFAFTLWTIVGMQRSAGLGAGFTLISITVILGTVAYFILRMRPPQTNA